MTKRATPCSSIIWIPLVLVALSASACGQIELANKKKKTASDTSQTTYNYWAPSSSPATSSGGSSTGTGTTTSNPVSQQYPPSYLSEDGLYSGMIEISANLGSTVTLSGEFDANPAPTYQWYRNGSKISGATSNVLEYGPVSQADYGVPFMLVATNSEGSAQSFPMYLTPIYQMTTVGGRDCNNANCKADPTTATKVCQMKFGEGARLASPNSYSNGYMDHKAFCSWNGSTWNCESNCSYCTYLNVIGTVHCQI